MSNRLYTSIMNKSSAFALKVQRVLSPFYAPVVNAGTAGLSDEAAKRVVIVNSISLITALLAFVIGNLFYVYAGLWRIQVPAIIESALFATIIFLNKRRLYSIASIGVLLVHCICALYFGALLGQLINISLIVVFLCGICFLVYSRLKHQLIGITVTLLTLFVLELNFYYRIIPPLPLSLEDQFLLRWLALPCFLLFDVVVVLYYVKENKALINRLKTFVYKKISHEIRNHLNAMALVAQLIKREIKLDDNLKKLEPYVDLLLTALHNMRNIINNVLDMAQIESGKAEKTEADTFSLRSLMRKIINLNKVSARSRGLRLELVIAPDMPDTLVADTLKLTMVITNLLGNAIKYADKNSVVKLEIVRTGDQFVMTFTNQCPDISADRQALLFDMYITDKRNRHIEGTGLGLYITRNKVDSMGGRIRLQSEGGCTNFIVTLPLCEGKTADIEEEVTESDIDLSNIHILLADDNEMNNMLFSKYLTLYGCMVTCATSGNEALQYLEKARRLPELIILDHQMPGLSGAETLLLLKQSPVFKHIPVIICTGTQEHEHTLMLAGAAAVVLKPIDPRSLFKVISQHLPHIDEVNTDLS